MDVFPSELLIMGGFLTWGLFLFILGVLSSE